MSLPGNVWHWLVALMSRTWARVAHSASGASSVNPFFGTGSMAVTLTAAGAQAGSTTWPNLPLGLPELNNYGFSDVPPVSDGAAVGSSGWYINNAGGKVSRISDVTAPFSPPYVVQFDYPVGFADGSAPGTLYLPLSNLTEIYIGLRWKSSNPWEFHSSGTNKILHVFAGSPGGEMVLGMYGYNGTQHLKCVTEWTGGTFGWEPGVASDLITLGAYHIVELYLKKSGGIMRWWLDGVLQGNESTVAYPSQNFVELHLSPTWGGYNPPESKSEQDYFWYDHVYVAGQ